MNNISDFITWCNLNSGFLTVIIFVLTLLIGWLSGFFAQIKKRPKFNIELIDIPTFCCKKETKRKENNHDCYRTIIALYLSITNIGTAPTSILDVEVGYKTNSWDHLFSWLWIKQTNSLEDFTANVEGYTKIYPFFTQKNYLMNNSTNLFINIGENKFGMKYFESIEYWGGYEPRPKNGKVKIIIKITDSYKKKYTKTFWIPMISIEDAQKFNSKIGMSIESDLKHNQQTTPPEMQTENI